ncbi:transposase [Citrobacter amalonaticus]|uniref:Transposase n=1 Tax=Citrobacter amalonaticus TaxID=35703 RepID=A0AAX2BHK8_CITAM|nr:transposase [Citrobacter amalonaticus]SBA08641.1 transposase [Citrobacter amalonaticus]
MGISKRGNKKIRILLVQCPECSYKKQKLEHQKGKLGQGINVQKKQLCCDLRTRKQAGQDSLGAYDATTDVRVVSL